MGVTMAFGNVNDGTKYVSVIEIQKKMCLVPRIRSLVLKVARVSSVLSDNFVTLLTDNSLLCV